MGYLIHEDVRDCAGAETYRLGDGSGAWTPHLVIGNTFSFRNVFAHEPRSGVLRSLFVEAAYQIGAPTGDGPSFIIGVEYCAGGCE